MNNYREGLLKLRKKRQKAKRWHQYIRYSIREYKKAIGCEICKGEFDPVALDLHHRDPKRKKFMISQFQATKNITNELILKEIDKCIVICANCHRKLSWNE